MVFPDQHAIDRPDKGRLLVNAANGTHGPHSVPRSGFQGRVLLISPAAQRVVLPATIRPTIHRQTQLFFYPDFLLEITSQGLALEDALVSRKDTSSDLEVADLHKYGVILTVGYH